MRTSPIPQVLGVTMLLGCAMRAPPPMQPLPAGDRGPAAPAVPTTTCVVVWIEDGDTIECRRIGLVRFIGMDTPELDQVPFGDQARRAVETWIHVGDTVALEPDGTPRDRYGRTLAYVWADSLMVNWLLVRHGWAVTLTFRDNVRYVDAFRDAADLARAEARGLWGVDGFRCPPVEHRMRRC